MYSRDNYIKYHASYRKAQKKYYDKNKSEICKKYAPTRREWDNKHRAYLNEHARLNKQLKKLENETYTPNVGKTILEILANKTYLSDLHARGLI